MRSQLFIIITLSIFIIWCNSYSYELKESTCYGTTSDGKLENGIKLPNKGPNFIPYSNICTIAGRTYVHSKVYKVVVNTYKAVEKNHPEKKYMYGETGLKNGGKFKPHKTHQNGLSVDFMVPVINDKNEPDYLPTSPFNKFGYSIEFDKYGKYKNFVIDWEAMAAHLKILHKEAKKAGIDIWRVIFDPLLQPYLFQTKDGEYLKTHLTFSKKRSWIRHDEHYHVDFKVPCKKTP